MLSISFYSEIVYEGLGGAFGQVFVPAFSAGTARASFIEAPGILQELNMKEGFMPRQGLPAMCILPCFPRPLEKLNEHVLTLSFPAGVQGRDRKSQLQHNSLTWCFLLECEPEQLMLTGLEQPSGYLLLAYLYAYSK